MRKLFLVVALVCLPTMAFAQAVLPQFPFPGSALGNANGALLNPMVNAINNLQGHGTPGAGTFTTLTATGNSSLANGNMTQLASTGALGITGATTITNGGALALAVGRLGATTPALRVDASATTSITGFRITAAAASGGLALAATGETNINTTLDAAGSGTLTLNGTATGNIILTRATTGLSFSGTGLLTARSGTATPAAASAVAGMCMGSSSICIYWGTGTPNTALTAAKGSLFIATDGSSASTRMFVNTDGSTAWAAVTTAS